MDSTTTPDTPAMMALRGQMRSSLAFGADVGKVAFDAVRSARHDGISDAQLRKVFDDLRAEGRLPAIEQ